MASQQPDVVMKSGDEQDAEDIYQEMCQNDLRPQEAIPKWEEFGIELGFSYGEIETISLNAAQRAVESCSLEMLSRWKEQTGSAATPDKLIKALRVIEQNRYAAQLQDALDRGTFDEEYTVDRIARDIAPYWDDVGIQLNVKRLSNIKTNNNPTEHKFKEMLRTWLSKQTCSKREVYVKLHEALIDIELIAAAGKFKEKVNKVLNFVI